MPFVQPLCAPIVSITKQIGRVDDSSLTRSRICVRRTPVYMSPEQLSQDNGSHGYLGSAVDVWASGVLLIVMLVSRDGIRDALASF